MYEPPPYQATTWGLLGSGAILVVVLMTVRLSQNPDTPRDGDLAAMPHAGEVTLGDEPEMDDEYWPCSCCHDDELPTNFEVRAMDEEHDELEFAHGSTWCMDCHDDAKRNRLALAGGTRIRFSKTHELCAQCHGKRYRDWEAGVHGKRTGHWRGDAESRPCIACHDPHVPGFEKLKPKPPPVPPDEIVARAGGEP